MKKYVLMFMLIIVSSAFLTAQSESDTGLKIKISITMEEFSRSYLEAHPDPVSKKGAAVLVIENNSDKAKSAKIGELVRAYLEEAMDLSLIFVLTDRENLNKIVDEIKFSASGMVSGESAVEIGEITGTAVLISGSVGEEGADFRIQLKLTEIETGEVLRVTGFSLPQKDLVDASTEREYSFVAANGIGFSVKPSTYFLGADMFNKAKPLFIDIAAKYRISRELMISGGMVTNVTGDMDIYRWDGDYGGPDVPYATAQPDLPFTPSSVVFDQITGALTTAFAPHLDFQYTINIAPVFNIGINLGVLAFFEPVMTVLYGGNNNSMFYNGTGYADDGTISSTSTSLKDSVPMQYIFENMIGGKIEICPEFFITPRIAITGVAGYLYTFPAPLRGVKATFGEWGYYAEAVASGFGADATERYYGFNPVNKPGGGLWTLDLSGFYAGAAVSVFF